jgi:transcriptional regulator with XRE-family HTH domain
MESPFSVTLKAARELLGVRQRDLGQHLGVAARTVMRWELGQTEVPLAMVERALHLLRASHPEEADRIAVLAGLPGAVAQEEARRAALDHAVYAVADALDVSPRRAREVLATFLTHLVAAGMTAPDARRRLSERVKSDAAAVDIGVPPSWSPVPASRDRST